MIASNGIATMYPIKLPGKFFLKCEDNVFLTILRLHKSSKALYGALNKLHHIGLPLVN